MSDSRTAACNILDAVLNDGKPLDTTLADDRGLAKLDPRDRAQARRIIATVLRRLGEVDARISECLDRPLVDRHAHVRNILRVGTAELLFLETPAHAAVDGAVRLASQYRRGALKGLVNAVLRRIGREPENREGTQSPGEINTPKWMLKRWQDIYGADTARAIADAHLLEPPLDFTLARRADPAEWAAKLDAEILPGGTLRRRTGGRISDLPGFDEGLWWIQDVAASLPAKLLRDDANARVIDLCAAPGGKTLQLADRGPSVMAVDISSQRLAALQDNLTRTGLTAEIVDADATQWRPEAPVDAVLLDAPCTATGTVRRHPDIPRRRRPADIKSATTLQDRLLTAAVNMVAPGGTIIYSVCSLEPEEGTARVDALLASGAPVTLDPISADDWPELDGLAPAAITPAGTLRTLPCHWSERGGMDGFFAARLIRN
ncbi:MAG: methyltransferase domain-containing protein [Proteobacteria bacterium]|nr:methyltransferase domain-containing protein [Pseudomonadota bacterium]